MEFRMVTVTEELVHLTLQSFEGQIRILHTLGYHQDRAQHIENLRRMIIALSEVVEETKNNLIEDLDGVYTSIADELAGQQELLAKAARKTDTREIVEFSKKLTQAQPQIINQLGMQEVEVEREIFQRFKVMSEKIHDLLAQTEKLRR